MAQTFTDLIRERSEANRGLHAFALGTFAETSARIIGENMTQPIETKHVIQWGRRCSTPQPSSACPLAMVLDIGHPRSKGRQLCRRGRAPMDFAIIGVPILGSGLLFEYASSRGGRVAHKAAVGIAVGRDGPSGPTSLSV